MIRRFAIAVALWTALVSVNGSSQSNGARLIDEFGNRNSESATARLQYAVNELANQLEKRPESMLQFVYHRGENQRIGEPYYRAGIQKAYLKAMKYDLDKIVFSVCEPGKKPLTQIWLIDSVKKKHSCSPEAFKINATTRFMTSYAPNDKYSLGTCCIIDDGGYSATMDVVAALAEYLKARPDSTGNIIVYGGTNVYWLSVPPAPHKAMRHIDPPSFISKLSDDIRKGLTASGISRSRVVLIKGGYRDTYASIDLWIVPPGGKRPKGTPDYFPKTKPRFRTNR